MQYTPVVHFGTRAEVIRGLMDEAAGIAGSGFMRNHAKCRELSRIQRQLLSIGVEMLGGDKKDTGYIICVDGHKDGCEIDKVGRCDCPAFYRVKGTLP